jgi:hypothetical protein
MLPVCYLNAGGVMVAVLAGVCGLADGLSLNGCLATSCGVLNAAEESFGAV